MNASNDSMKNVLSRLRHHLTEDEKFGRFSVFAFESPKSSELGPGLEEASLLEAACNLSFHDFHAFRPITRTQLQEQLNYVFGTWEPDERYSLRVQFAIHVSCHGNADGIRIGTEDLAWKDLGDVLREAQRGHEFPFMLTLSACGGTKLFLGEDLAAATMPVYVFSFESDVLWADAALTWALLYRCIRQLKVGEKESVQKIIDQIRVLGLGDLRYHRWTGTEFKIYPPR